MRQFGLRWIVIEVLSLLVSVTTLYLIIAFCIMERRSSLRGKENKRLKIAVKVLMFFGLFFTFTSSTSSQLGMWLPFDPDRTDACAAYAYLVTWSHSFSIGSTFLALWVKLKLFYYHPILKSTLSKSYICFSYTVAVLIGVCAIAHGTLFTIPNHFFFNETLGCTSAPNPGFDWEFLPLVEFTVIMLFAVTCAVSLSVLLAYPLIKTRSLANESTIAAKRKLIKRLFVSTSVCVISYLTASILLIVLASGNLNQSNLIFDVSLLVSQISISCSFTSWRRRLFPCSDSSPDSDSAPCSRQNFSGQHRPTNVEHNSNIALT